MKAHTTKKETTKVTYEHRATERFYAGEDYGPIYVEKGEVLEVTRTPEKLAKYFVTWAGGRGCLGPFGPEKVQVVEITKTIVTTVTEKVL